jgi:hypothetical protein
MKTLQWLEKAGMEIKKKIKNKEDSNEINDVFTLFRPCCR